MFFVDDEFESVGPTSCTQVGWIAVIRTVLPGKNYLVELIDERGVNQGLINLAHIWLEAEIFNGNLVHYPAPVPTGFSGGHSAQPQSGASGFSSHGCVQYPTPSDCSPCGQNPLAEMPKNNDGRSTCAWCGAPTRKAGDMGQWNICTKCGK